MNKSFVRLSNSKRNFPLPRNIIGHIRDRILYRRKKFKAATRLRRRISANRMRWVGLWWATTIPRRKHSAAGSYAAKGEMALQQQVNQLPDGQERHRMAPRPPGGRTRIKLAPAVEHPAPGNYFSTEPRMGKSSQEDRRTRDSPDHFPIQ